MAETGLLYRFIGCRAATATYSFTTRPRGKLLSTAMAL